VLVVGSVPQSIGYVTRLVSAKWTPIAFGDQSGVTIRFPICFILHYANKLFILRFE